MSITKRMTKYLNESYRVDEARAVFPERRTRYSKWELFDALYEAISRINDYSAENISDTNDTKILSDLQSAKDEYVQSIETLVQNYFPDVSWDYGYWRNPIFDGKNKEQNTLRFIDSLNQSIDAMAHIKSYIADEEAIRYIDDVCQPALDNLVQRFGDATGNEYSPLPESYKRRGRKINEETKVTLAQMKSDIKKAKAKLKNKKPYENFGQKEIRKIGDKYMPLQLDYFSDYNSLMNEFVDWCANVELSESCNTRGKKKINEDCWIIIPTEHRYDEPIDLFKFAKKYGVFNSEEEVDKEIERLAPDRWDAFITYRLIEESYKGRKKPIKESHKRPSRKPLRESIQITNEEAETIIGMFDNTYDFLYDHGDNVAGFDEAMEYGEWLIANEKDLLKKLVQARGDYFMFDREVAALGFTVNDWLNA